VSKKGRQFYEIFKREWNKRFQTVKEDGTPLELPKETQNEDKLSEEEMEAMELTEEEVEEMELAAEIGDFLDGIVEKIESEEDGKSKDQ
jgi:hypothetical protein